MTDKPSDKQRTRRRLLFIVMAAALIGFALVIAAVLSNGSGAVESAEANATSFAEAMTSTDASLGAALAGEQDCGLCHIEGENRLAPPFQALDRFAYDSTPDDQSLTAYLYDSIVQPGAYLVDGFTDAMPSNYSERLAQQEIAHIVAWLLAFSEPAQDG